nr:peptidylprolyl isomerase [uncultured Oscillibacter sp.]
MSASREKKSRQELNSSGWTNPKTAREAQQRREERRSSILYGVIAVVFVLVAITVIVWKSNIIQKTATAATIDGQKYTAAEVDFHYQNVYRNFINNNYTMLSYGLLSLNTSASLSGQTLTEGDAAMLNLEPDAVGQTWKDYFVDQALEQMSAVQAVLKTAKDEGFQYPASVQENYDAGMQSLRDNAAASGVSADRYLQASLGSTMTEKVYGQRLMATLQYEAYANAKQDSLTYSDAELEDAYQADRNTYDRVDYEYVTVSGTAEGTTDADGNAVEPTEEETAAAMAAAKAKAEEVLAAYEGGQSLESQADTENGVTYAHSETASYSSTPVLEWAFDNARREGDVEVIENSSSYTVALFHSKSRFEYNTVDVRHVLIRPEETTLSSEDEGYQADVDAKRADAKAKAEELYAQWQSGEATEESFAQLARDNSADGNADQGGIYTEVYRGQMVTTFNDWCFDTGRKPGDTGIVETDYGYHIMYFVGQSTPYWKVQVRNSLVNTAMDEWYGTFTQNHTITKSDSGMKYVG